MSSVSRREKRSGRRALFIAVPVALLSIAPLAWAFIASIRPGSAVFSNLYPVTWRTFIPESVTFENYVNVLSGPFAISLVNSVVVVIASVAIGVAISSLAAFALSAIQFPGRSLLFGVLVVSFLIPFEAIAIPLSSTFRDMGLANTYSALILPAIGNGLAIFLLRQFFLGIPQSVAEAARVDGLGWFGIYRRIYMPLSGGALVGAGMIIFVFQWQAFLWPLLIAPSSSMRVAPVALADFAQESGVDYGQMFAGTILTALIPLLLLLFFQKQFTGSLANTGSKE